MNYYLPHHLTTLPQTQKKQEMDIKIRHDGALDLVTAKAHNSKQWYAQRWAWSGLLQEFSKPRIRKITHSQYVQLPDTRRQKVKDVGGFCGAKLKGKERRKENVISRQLVTLDLDKASGKEWDLWRLIYGYAACVYSTIKHLPSRPRIRFVLPLDRPVTPDEYGAIARRVASWLSIEAMDSTCFRVAQFMYWPTSPADVKPLFDFIDGPWLSADYVLSTYENWRDPTEWPLCPDEVKQPGLHGEKQQDPTEKANIVGTFCRLYTIQEAIEFFLPDVYTPCDIPDRYTYSAGSSYAGLVIYSGMYAYSNHSTDPAASKLCNAFDLVRLHLFGKEDEGADPLTPPSKLPSFRKMEKFVRNTDRVRKSIEATNEIWRQKTEAFKRINVLELIGLEQPAGYRPSADEDFKNVTIAEHKEFL